MEQSDVDDIETSEDYRSLGGLTQAQFFENVGQLKNNSILYYGRIPSGSIGFGVSTIYLAGDGVEGIVTLTFDDSTQVIPEGVGTVGYLTNFFLEGGIECRNVRGFTSIVFINLWQGIDLHYFTTPNGVKYEFVLAPGADPSQIRIRSTGHDVISLDDGSLSINSGQWTLVDEGLIGIQGETQVDVQFQVLDWDVFGFKIGDYDTTMPLKIDPLIYSSIVGGSDVDFLLWSQSIVIDDAGSVYMVGTTNRPDFPMVDGYDSSFNGNRDAYILKLNSNGSNILYSTFIGGSDSDYGESIAVSQDGSIFLTGTTMSSDFPTTALDQIHAGELRDCFVVKLTPDGDSLVYSTKIGGALDDYGYSIVVDAFSQATITGSTYSSDFPVMSPLFDTNKGLMDSFVLQLDETGTTLRFATFIGGPHHDIGKAIAQDVDGNLYVSGYSMSTDFAGFSMRSHSVDPNWDCFVFKMGPDGSSLSFVRFFGGLQNDYGDDIAVDSLGNAYITGTTSSKEFPTINAYDDSLNGSSDCFVTKLNSSTGMIEYSTFIGGMSNDAGKSIAVSDSGIVFVTGRTASSDFPIANAYDSIGNGGGSDCVVFELSNDGKSLIYSTFIGGSHYDAGNAIAIDSNGTAYIAGHTYSHDFPTLNIVSDSQNQTCDYFILKLPSNGDSDFDSILDTVELSLGINPFSSDTDQDLIDDWSEIEIYHTDPANNDSDNDSILDGIEIFRYNTSALLSDTDNDSIDDWNEIFTYLSDPTSVDSDLDAVDDWYEIFIYGTSPYNPDSDFDTMPDGWEINHGLDPLWYNVDGDLDMDNVSNGLEYIYDSHPNMTDSDSDMIDDWSEIFVYNTLPNNSDSDSDSASDWDEIFIHHTLPREPDSDLDLMPDGWEILYGLDPLLNDSTDDVDLDSLTNLEEYIYGAKPNMTDSDLDSIDDWDEVFVYHTLANDEDSDKDRINDWNELFLYHTSPLRNDSDFDFLDDWTELYITLTSPLESDTELDAMPDGWEVQFGLNPLVNDSLGDLDLDGLSNLLEYENNAWPNRTDSDSDLIDDWGEVFFFGTNPGLNDSDFDTMLDPWEIANRLDPLIDDSFEDPDMDGLLNLEEYVLGTNPFSEDSDHDSMPDKWEVDNGLNATYDDAAEDLDLDNLSNLLEYHNGANPMSGDSDQDSIGDWSEVYVYRTNPASSDSDFDNVTDAQELFTYKSNPNLVDTDQDSISDWDEIFVYKTRPWSADSDLDSYSDYWEIRNRFDPLNPTVPIWEIILHRFTLFLVTVLDTCAIVVILLVDRRGGISIRNRASPS